MNKTIQLIKKLDKEKEKLEHTLGIYKSGFGIEITPNMDIEMLSVNDCYMVHSLLHLFFNTGVKGLQPKDIEKLHSQVRKRITHENFDNLDYEHL